MTVKPQPIASAKEGSSKRRQFGFSFDQNL